MVEQQCYAAHEIIDSWLRRCDITSGVMWKKRWPEIFVKFHVISGHRYLSIYLVGKGFFPLRSGSRFFVLICSACLSRLFVPLNSGCASFLRPLHDGGLCCRQSSHWNAIGRAADIGEAKRVGESN